MGRFPLLGIVPSGCWLLVAMTGREEEPAGVAGMDGESAGTLSNSLNTVYNLILLQVTLALCYYFTLGILWEIFWRFLGK